MTKTTVLLKDKAWVAMDSFNVIGCCYVFWICLCRRAISASGSIRTDKRMESYDVLAISLVRKHS